MNVLILGGGGREHALAWKAAQSSKVDRVFVAPGNAGTQCESKTENVAIDPMDFEALTKFAKENAVALTIVGPEAPLVDGVVDFFIAQGLACFGPSKNASQLEGSKAFTKDFLTRHCIPTSAYQTFEVEAEAIAYVKERGTPIVIKADGLAAGKGVIIANNENEAIATIKDMLSGNRFGEAGHRVVVEDFMEGEEASFIAMVDGVNVLPMATSQDHKARDNGDKGPNTGGMGAYSPAPAVTDEVYEKIMQQVILPTVEGMAADGNSYTGFLYAGLMISPQGNVDVVEFNCRFGDPEAQPVMMRLQSDLVSLCLAALEQRLDAVKANWDPRSALGVVLASGGYPDAYDKGVPINGHDQATEGDQKVFHAGTKLVDEQVVTNGGRVLCATALGNTVTEAQREAYKLVNNITWDKVYFRTDIGYRAIERENKG